MKIGIVGSRTFKSYKVFKKHLELILRNNIGFNSYTMNKINIISGGANGVDKFAEEFTEEVKCNLTVYKADWEDFSEEGKREKVIIKTNQYGKEYNANAGKERNHLIVRDSDIIIAFMKEFSTGTAHDIYLAKTIYNKSVYLLQFNKYERYMYTLIDIKEENWI